MLHIPRGVEAWISDTDNRLTLYNSAYWVSLRDRMPVDNDESVTVEVPLVQRLTVLELKRLMDLIADGERP